MNPTEQSLQTAIEEYYSTDSEKSMETLKGLLEEKPDDIVLQAFLADAYTKHGKDDEAKVVLQGLEGKDLSADALIFVVRAYDALGHQDSAKEVLVKHFSLGLAPALAPAPEAKAETAPALSFAAEPEAEPEAKAEPALAPSPALAAEPESKAEPEPVIEESKESAEVPKQAGGKKTRKNKKNAAKRKSKKQK
jgi:hypothetical protein